MSRPATSAPLAAPARQREERQLPPVVAALLDPTIYPHPAENIELVQTHISWVVLAGEYVYKLRKPVNLGFLDFSTIERRVADCEAEIRLNRRLSPDLYLGVVSVVERAGRLHLDGEGRLVEPAVKMRRLPSDGMLPALIRRRAATPALMRRIAARLARFHARAATGPGVDEHGSLATIRGNWEENFQQTIAYVGRTLDRCQFAAVRAFVERFIGASTALFERRVAAGRIRDGHGDLHAGHICLAGRRLYFFDCIEFNDRFRCADVAAEVAFLAMDLDYLGQPELSRVFVDAYVAASGDRELLQLLDFYRCYRAYVRGKVESFLLDQDVPARERERAAAEACDYFALAAAYARRGSSAQT